MSESSVRAGGMTLVLARDRHQFARWRAAEGISPFSTQVMWVPTYRLLQRVFADKQRRPRVIRLHRWQEGFTAREQIDIETLLDRERAGL